jgi:hypothetical protein
MPDVWDLERHKPGITTYENTKPEQMTSEEIWIAIDAMERQGGSFVKRLADLYRHADNENASKIINAWPALFEHYLKVAREIQP